MSDNAEKQLSLKPHIDPTAPIVKSRLGRYTEIGPHSRIQESNIDDYSYILDNGDVIYSRIGRFCSMAAMVRINPGNHPMHRATQHHFTYRSKQFGMGSDDPDVFAARCGKSVEIGHDVWIGYGTVVLPGVRLFPKTQRLIPSQREFRPGLCANGFPGIYRKRSCAFGGGTGPTSN